MSALSAMVEVVANEGSDRLREEKMMTPLMLEQMADLATLETELRYRRQARFAELAGQSGSTTGIRGWVAAVRQALGARPATAPHASDARLSPHALPAD